MNQKKILSIIFIIAVTVSFLILYFNQSSDLAAIIEKKTELEKSKSILIDKVSILENSLVSNKTALIKLESELLEAKTSHDETMTELSRISSSLASRDLQIFTLQSNLAESNAKISSLVNSSAKVSSLEKSLAEAKDKISSLTSEIANYLLQIKVMSMPISDRHLNGTILKIEKCSECHVNVESLAAFGQSNQYHNIHLNQSSRLLSFKCIDCHKNVDILSNSTDLGRVVDVSVCKNCHTTFPSKAYMGRLTTPKDFALRFYNCISCHDDWKNQMSAATYVKIDNVVEKDCVTCHLNKPLFKSEKPSVDIPCGMCH